MQLMEKQLCLCQKDTRDTVRRNPHPQSTSSQNGLVRDACIPESCEIVHEDCRKLQNFGHVRVGGIGIGGNHAP